MGHLLSTSFRAVGAVCVSALVFGCSSSSATGSKGSGNDGGNGNGAVTPLPPFPTNGMPLTGPDDTWTWVDFPDSTCRDGSMAGVSVNMHSASKNVMIFLMGGGACFDAVTCVSNPASVAGQTGGGGNTGVFDRTNPNNPMKDWNWVFVPYCTGDVHVGTIDNGMVTGVTGQQHFDGSRVAAQQILETAQHRTHLRACLARPESRVCGCKRVVESDFHSIFSA